MARINDNYLKLKAGYLFPEIARRVNVFAEKNPDAKATKKIVYCLNEETNGVTYKVSWSKNRVPIENKVYYNLILKLIAQVTTNRCKKERKRFLTYLKSNI